jgi:hybrid cluster-associated redox disulfide protein
MVDENNSSEQTDVQKIKPVEEKKMQIKNNQKNNSKLFIITRDTLIVDIIRAYPELAEDLLSAGFHCVGCPAAAYETIYEGSAAHGADDEMIDNLIKNMNEKIRKLENEKKV